MERRLLFFMIIHVFYNYLYDNTTMDFYVISLKWIGYFMREILDARLCVRYNETIDSRKRGTL